MRNTNDTERKTVEIVRMNFEIDDHMNLKWEKEIKESREQRDDGWQTNLKDEKGS